MGNPREWTVGKGALIGVSLIALLGAGVYVTRTFCWSDCKTIKALNITLTPTNWAVGHYKMVSSLGGIETKGMGGACIVWKSTANQNCKVDYDCKFPAGMIGGMQPDPLSPSGFSPAPAPEFDGAYGYCSPEKTCWIKVKGTDCKKSADVTPPLALKVDEVNSTNEASLLLARAGLYGLGKGPPKIQGRVVACLNGLFTPGPGVKPPCAGGPGDVRHDWGKPPQAITVPMGPAPPLCPPGQEGNC